MNSMCNIWPSHSEVNQTTDQLIVLCEWHHQRWKTWHEVQQECQLSTVLLSVRWAWRRISLARLDYLHAKKKLKRAHVLHLKLTKEMKLHITNSCMTKTDDRTINIQQEKNQTLRCAMEKETRVTQTGLETNLKSHILKPPHTKHTGLFHAIETRLEGWEAWRGAHINFFR